MSQRLVNLEPAVSRDDRETVQQLNAVYHRMKEQVGQVIVGQVDVVEQMLIAIFCKGHALLEGVPGLAKTLLVSTLSKVLDLSFKRIQFTPDLMPADITGTDILEIDQASGRRNFRFVHGPIFANMVLADEINRTPPKTQAALLEAMQERQVTVGEVSYELPEPFFVLATQNPIEQEGTFPLPEAQLDRFMFNILVGYPTAAEEQQIIKQVTGTSKPGCRSCWMEKRCWNSRRSCAACRWGITWWSMPPASSGPRVRRKKRPRILCGEMVGWGAGPRAGIYLITAAKARAILQGRYHATTGDVQHCALPVLRHRIVTTFNAEAAGVKSEQIIRMLLEHFKPKAELEV